MQFLHLLPLIIVGLFLFFVAVKIIYYRRVVATNSVNIVQSSRRRVSYGGGPDARNTYYAWPSWIPVIGVTITSLPVNVFQLSLSNYEAYDIDRVPFVLDLAAFFRIDRPNMAAERIRSFQELQQQLDIIVKGAARKILANAEINEILGNRAVFGDKFTEEVKGQLEEWGVTPVKNIELMDIRDAQESHVIENIMAKKKSAIEMESRMVVANNMQKAKEAEIAANQAIGIKQQEAEEQVGIRTAAKDQQIGINQQRAQQAIQEESRTTAEKQMAVKQVQTVRQAEITREANVVQADQDRQMAIIAAEATKQKTITEAEGTLEQAKRVAEGTRVKGEAEGAAQTAVLMAPVTTQITLAKEIGGNQGYQTYLVSIKQIEASRDVGIEQAKAMEQADIKIIAQAGTPGEGLGSVREIFTVKGGQAIGAALEGLNNTDVGSEVLQSVTKAINGSASPKK